MIRTPRLFPLLLALALAAAPLRAQDDAPEPKTPAAAPADGAGRQTPAPPPSAGNAKQRTDSGGDAKPRANSGAGSPFDYRPSEEISEDLPVSFPADI